MVARDPLNKTASFVNPLKLVTNDEKEVFQRGIENKKRWVPPFFARKGGFLLFQKEIPSSWYSTAIHTLNWFSRRISMNADSLFKVNLNSLCTIAVWYKAQFKWSESIDNVVMEKNENFLENLFGRCRQPLRSSWSSTTSSSTLLTIADSLSRWTFDVDQQVDWWPTRWPLTNKVKAIHCTGHWQ